MDLDLSHPPDLASTESTPGAILRTNICVYLLHNYFHSRVVTNIHKFGLIKLRHPSQALWLVLKRDPDAGKARETLDREVSSLETYVEAIPSLGVMMYISLTEPHLFYSSSNKINLTRAYWVTCFTMALFLKAGPCFFIPREGYLSGIATWRFAAVFIVNMYSLHCKISWPREGINLVVNILSVYLLSATIALFSLYQALGGWQIMARMVVNYPALIILPIFGYFTFGKIHECQDTRGVALNWNWTLVNMLASLSLTTAMGLLDLSQSHTHLRSLHIWVTGYSGSEHFLRERTFASYVSAAVMIVFSVLLTVFLYWHQIQEYGVLLPHLPQ